MPGASRRSNHEPYRPETEPWCVDPDGTQRAPPAATQRGPRPGPPAHRAGAPPRRGTARKRVSASGNLGDTPTPRPRPELAADGHP